MKESGIIHYYHFASLYDGYFSYVNHFNLCNNCMKLAFESSLVDTDGKRGGMDPIICWMLDAKKCLNIIIIMI